MNSAEPAQEKLIFEIGFPFFVCFRVLRPWLLLGGVAFHFGIWLHTEVGWFSFVTISWYPLFLSGPFLARIVTGEKKRTTETQRHREDQEREEEEHKSAEEETCAAE